MPTGLLEVSGTIDLTQFWPQNESDGDTVKVLLAGANAFRFRPNPNVPFKVTRAFDGAMTRGAASKPTVDKQGRITIRLQAIDAPELHYRPTAPSINGKKPTPAQRTRFNAANGNFRQRFGETATVQLHDFLAKLGAGPIACVVRTAVDHPNEVFDTFGRFIGSIIVTRNRKEQDANLWLVQQGWAFPTFYSSMTAAEINQFAQASEAARKAKLGLWRQASSNLKPFDPKLVFRNHGTPNPAADAGPVLMPKLFRRRSTFAVVQAAGMFAGRFKDYLQAEPDHCFETADFLANGLTAAKPRRLDEFVTAGSQFTVGAKDLVFQENPSRLVDANGKPVTTW